MAQLFLLAFRRLAREDTISSRKSFITISSIVVRERESRSAVIRATAKDKRRYVLAEKRDYAILGEIYELEKCKLSAGDKKIVALIRTQLERDWRTPLLNFLQRMMKKYKKVS